MKITVHVTKEIIREAMYCHNKCNPTNCAIALAVRGVFPESKVRLEYISVYKTNNLRTDYIGICALPLEASDFITEFDRLSPEQRLLMDPISFEIDVPSEVIDQIGISQVYKVLSESRTLELATNYQTI